MEDPLKFSLVEGVLGISIVLAFVATVLLYWRFRRSELGIFHALVGLVLAWFVPVVGPGIVIGAAILEYKQQLNERERHV